MGGGGYGGRLIGQGGGVWAGLDGCNRCGRQSEAFDEDIQVNSPIIGLGRWAY